MVGPPSILSGECCGQRGPAVYSPWGRRESDAGTYSFGHTMHLSLRDLGSAPTKKQLFCFCKFQVLLL